jgi:hypothetical protein
MYIAPVIDLEEYKKKKKIQRYATICWFIGAGTIITYFSYKGMQSRKINMDINERSMERIDNE